ncbi:MAG: rRNA adenine N-6-methyltransferase family protein [Actinomycetota bacterium]
MSAARGQHFLAGFTVAQRLVRDAEVTAADLVLDLGAGTGLITAALLRRGARVIAVEVDPKLARGLRRRYPQARVLERDLLTLRWPTEPFAVVANPPFSCTSALLRSLLDDPRTRLARADVVLQAGAVRARAVDPPGLCELQWAPWWTLAPGRHLPPSSFRPPPRCGAAVLTVRRRTAPLLPRRAAHDWRRFLRRSFTPGRSLAEWLRIYERTVR